MNREAFEEAQIKLDKVICIGTRNINHSFIVGFACTTKSEKVVLQKEEVAEYKWTKLDELEKLNLTFKELPVEAKKARKILFAK
jgi:NADH pyrophosphatase NudC (nudix superfamily)